MDIALWIAQVLLAVVIALFGFVHAFRREETAAKGQGTDWVLAVPKPLLTTIGLLEFLGAVGLILPGLTQTATWLTPLAAWLVALLMVFAMIFHARRENEGRNIALNVILLGFALFIALGRTFVAPL